MRSLKKNQQTVYFKPFITETEIVDEYGNLTGEYEPVYGALESVDICVSPNKGNYTVEQFGGFEDYDRTMLTADTSVPITEQTVLWIDGADTNDAYNYVVTKRAPWKNSIMFAVKQVDVALGRSNENNRQSLQ